MDTPWKTANWHVSPWNYLPEVTRDFTPPQQVKIHDIILRDGEQQAKVIFTKDDNIRIAEKLSEIGVHRIDTGIDYAKLNETAKLVQELSGVTVAGNRPFIGNDAYTIESGIVTVWFRNVFEKNPTTVFPVHPDFVGHEKPQIAMGKKSGLDNVKKYSLLI